MFLHIALGNELLRKVQAANAGKEEIRAQIEDNAKAGKGIVEKARIVDRLHASFDAIRKTLAPVRAGTLGRDIDFFGSTMTQRAALAFLDTHAAEHLGQAIAYTRVNGMAPPWN